MSKHQEDLLIVTNPTSEPFTSTWAKIARTLQPGERKIWPRYIAEHFAKHLADKMLLGMEKEEELKAQSEGRQYKPRSLVNSSKHRPPVISSIITGTYQYFEPGSDDEQARIQAQIDALNPAEQNEKALDLGEEHDPLMGNLQKLKEDNETPEVPSNPPLPTNPAPAASVPLPPGAGQSPLQQFQRPAQPPQQPTTQPQQTTEAPEQRLARLRNEADALGMEYPKTLNGDQLEKRIKEFAGAV